MSKSPADKAARPPLEPVAPGTILLEVFMRPSDVSQNRLARDMDVPVSRIAEIVGGTRAITADTALRLACFFGTSAELWLNLQAGYDLRRARHASGATIGARVRPLPRR
jgi:antitoxin HigA-1